MEKKIINIVVGCYNEEENVEPLVARIREVTDKELPNYIVKIMFIDNYSTDNTRHKLREICAKDKNVQAIFNARNFGQLRSPFHALLQADGACAIAMAADFQDPPEYIPQFVKKWEEGYKIVVGTKKLSMTNPLMQLVRKLYYKLVKKYSTIEQIENFAGFALYDQSFIQVLRDLKDPLPYVRGIVSELGFKRYELEFVQDKRRAGISSNHFASLYDVAMNGFTSYTKVLVRAATFVGVGLGFLSLIGLIVFLVFLCVNYGTPYQPSLVYLAITIGGIFTAIILFFIGMVGEYVLQINTRILRRPYAVEEERINFDTEERKDLL